MHQFEIWAPRPKRVAVRVDEATMAMQGPDADGWWRCTTEGGDPGTDYGFLVDDDARCYPDPRSCWQPNGVHGMSRVYDHGAYEWTDTGFRPVPLASAIIYELHIGTFTPAGTLDAAIEKLDYLAGLGVTHVELMPVNAFAGNHGWGYDGVALYAVHGPFGGPDALKRFVNAAHARELAVLLDVVYNHFGPEGNYTGNYGPYLIEAHKTPWGGAVNLEAAGSREVRRFFCDNALMWLRHYHIDGLRLDAVHAFVDRSAIHFLEQLSGEVEALSAGLARELVLIAESDLNDPRMVTAREAGGLGMDAQWSDDFHHALFSVLNRKQELGYYVDFGSLAQLAKSLERTFVYDGIYSRYRRRIHGRPVGALSQHRFLGYIQTHDQVGNRAVGDRVSQVVGHDRTKIAAAFVLMSPFIPMIFEGEEWAASTPFQYFADHDDPELARAVSKGRRGEFAAFGWPPDAIPDPECAETFQRSKLNWNELDGVEHAAMLAWYRDLIGLRRSTPCLNVGEPGNIRVTYDEKAGWLRMERGSITVICNLGEKANTFLFHDRCEIALASRADLLAGQREITLGSDAVAVVRAMS
jgi:maltooligosyltrehalose trehalohydrolase